MSLEQFENMTIRDLRKLTADYLECQDLILKQEETIKLLKIKYPSKTIDGEEFDLNKLIEECGK